MRDAGVDYFVTAQRSADAEKNAEAAAKAQRVTEAARPSYDKLQQSLGSARDSFRAYQMELAQISKHLTKDQSAERIASASDRFAAARQRATDLKAAIRAVQADTDGVSKAIREAK
jgi:hypothetical protein